jgi:phosphatidate cytidylyltransferase
MAGEITKRTLSAIVLAAVCVSAIAAGGIYFQILMSAATLLMLHEWLAINKNRGRFFYTGVAYLTVQYIFWLRESIVSPEGVLLKVSYIFTIVWSCDIFAYFGGKLLKGRKLAPSISPKKTWSGAIVGALASFATTLIFYRSVFEERIIFLIALIISSIIGDLLESKVKRMLGVKDTGSLIPGHGGVIDRLDSFLLATYTLMIFEIFSNSFNS